jgi:hypothetical protein
VILVEKPSQNRAFTISSGVMMDKEGSWKRQWWLWRRIGGEVLGLLEDGRGSGWGSFGEKGGGGGFGVRD